MLLLLGLSFLFQYLSNPVSIHNLKGCTTWRHIALYEHRGHGVTFGATLLLWGVWWGDIYNCFIVASYSTVCSFAHMGLSAHLAHTVGLGNAVLVFMMTERNCANVTEQSPPLFGIGTMTKKMIERQLLHSLSIRLLLMNLLTEFPVWFWRLGRPAAWWQLKCHG